MLVQCDIVSTNEQVAPLVMIPESLIHSDLDKVRRLGGISCYFSENYFSGCFLAHWTGKGGKGSRMLNSSLRILVLFPAFIRFIYRCDFFSTAEYFSAISCLFFADFPILNFDGEKFTLLNFCFVFLTAKLNENK